MTFQAIILEYKLGELWINTNKNLSDLLFEIANIVRKYEIENTNLIDNKNINFYINDDSDEIPNLYSLSEVLKLFPKLSKYLITNAINCGKLKVTWIGSRRFFYLEDIKKYLDDLEYKNKDISSEISDWRKDK